MKKLACVLFLLLCISQSSYGQLSNFTLTVTKTEESCTGNGSLTFNVTNTTPGSTIIYRIYLLPDVINSIVALSGNTYGGLASGTYRVIATQTLGSSSGTQQQDITILDTRTYVTYLTSGIATSCNTGTININVLTGNPVSYEIITGPVIVAPQTANSFTNLPEGTYNIRVNDACGEGVVQTYTLTFSNLPNLTINTPATDCPLTSCTSIGISYSVVSDGTATIRYPLNVEITVFPPTGPPIVLTHTLTSGDPGSLLLSDIIPFYYDQLYSYNIKIIDACGNVYIKNNNAVNLHLGVGAIQTYNGCIKGIRVELCNFLPPYNVTFLSSPAGFNPSTYNSIHPGPFTSGVLYYVSTPTSEIPNGNYTIQVTDACNHTATCQITVKNIEPLYMILVEPTTCDINTYIQIPRDIFAGPFITTAIITAASAGLGSPIPYDVTSQIQSGILLMQLPPGTYTIQGMDICGHPYSYTFTMPPKAFVVNALAVNINGCSPNGRGSIRLTSVGALITSVIITQAPAALAQPLPYDVSSLIPPGGSALVVIPNLPDGDYVLHITDSCGNTYIKNVTISVNISIQPLLFLDRKGCGENFDSIALTSPNGALQSVIITAAPPSFPFPLPYDVSFNVATNGSFYMNSFPEGSYTFYTKDICGIERTPTYALVGYHSGGNIDIISNCGAFDVNMNFTDNAINQSNLFWLQKLNTTTGQWTHPLTGVVYPPGSLPNAGNSYMLTISTINYNIIATGTFRILARYSYYNNDTPSLISCIEPIKTFEYTGELKILSAYAIPCVDGGSQVFIITNGTPPLNYQVTTKDGLPFLIENGTSNSFSGLQPGVYNFRVQDICGNIVNRLFDINTLQQPEISSSNFCEGLNGQLSVQPFSFLFYEWWKDGSPGTILSTTNTLTFSPYTNANAGIYHVRIYSTTLNSCVDRVLTYTLSPTALPNAGLDGIKVICGNLSGVNLFTLLNGTYDAGGTWTELTSSGMLIGNNWTSTGLPVGTYVFRYTVNGFCNTTDFATVTITLNPAVEDPVITAVPDYCPGDAIALSIQAIPGAVYQWSGPDNCTSTLQNPTITNATAVNAGTYSVTATIGECHSLASVVINSKPAPDYTYDSSCSAGVFTVAIIPTPDSVFDPNTATYSWTGPNNFTSTSNPLILTNQLSGDYTVMVTNNEGCFSPQTIAVTSTFCDFPNVITPGGDGINDSFDLTNYDVEWFEVYSRWGRLVYRENNYLRGWYGQNMHGGFLPDSTYYYIVKLRNGEEKHGWIFVGRG